MTFGGHSLFVARVASFAAERINTQGQIVQIYFKRKDFLTRNHVAGCKFHLQPTRCRLAREKQRFREGTLSFGCVRVVIMINVESRTGQTGQAPSVSYFLCHERLVLSCSPFISDF